MMSLRVTQTSIRTLAQKAQVQVTSHVGPAVDIHCHAVLHLVVVGFVWGPFSEGGGVAINPLPGISVKAEPGLL